MPGRRGDSDLQSGAVQAGAAEDGVALDEGDVPVGKSFVDEGVAGSGTDDGEIEVLHGPNSVTPLSWGA